ncbi:MAG: CheR family methyltransferase [bacterium]
MSKRIPNSLLAELSDYIRKQMGLHYPKEKWLDLLKSIREASLDFGFDDVEACINWLISSPLKKNQIEILAKKLTIGETYFLREQKTINALEKKVLPDLIEKKRNCNEKFMKIWSAGCCTGEEPYTIAIILSRLIPDYKDWSIRIYGTDINPDYLQRASVGIYRPWSFRGTPYWLKNKYFNRVGDNLYEIKSSIKEMVCFSYLNLMNGSYPSENSNFFNMDIIFCRNVLMYFMSKSAKEIGEKFYQTLHNDGWLVVGASETSHILFPDYISVTFPGAILYRKDSNFGFDDSDITTFAPQKLKHTVTENNISFDSATIGKDDILLNDDKQNVLKSVLEDNPLDKIVYSKSEVIPEDKDVVEEDTIYDKAIKYYNKGNYIYSIEMLKKFPEDKKNAKVLMLISKNYANLGDIENALEWCELSLKKEQLDPTYHYFHGIILQEKGKFKEAKESLKRAIYLNPDFVISHYMMGNINRHEGKIKESNKYYENVLSLLKQYKNEDILPETEGITAGRLRELVDFVKDVN